MKICYQAILHHNIIGIIRYKWSIRFDNSGRKEYKKDTIICSITAFGKSNLSGSLRS
jgi:hypothetical protein